MNPHWHSGGVSRNRHRKEYYRIVECGKAPSLVEFGTLEDACKAIDPEVLK